MAAFWKDVVITACRAARAVPVSSLLVSVNELRVTPSKATRPSGGGRSEVRQIIITLVCLSAIAHGRSHQSYFSSAVTEPNTSIRTTYYEREYEYECVLAEWLTGLQTPAELATPAVGCASSASLVCSLHPSVPLDPSGGQG
eukprot:scaffold204621_cov17-Prasinocladus_malaysianus.AAC.1